MHKVIGKEGKLTKIVDVTNRLKRDNLRLNTPEFIVLHSTRSYPEFEDVYNNHVSRGFSGVGYHFFISDSNRIYQARPIALEGAHAIGFNTNSIGISFYTPDGKLSEDKVQLGKGLIDSLQSRLGKLPVISHTFAQVEYINRLLRENNHPKQFVADHNIVLNQNYETLRAEIDEFMGHLSSDEHMKLKQQLKKFKNCPGELFTHFI